MNRMSHAVLYRVASLSEQLPSRLLGGDVECYDDFFQSFGVDDARKLISRAYLAPQEYSVQVLVVRAEFITHEAQNALLKLFEEPPLSTRLVLVVPLDLTLLPTLLSRLHDETILTTERPETISDEFSAFTARSYAERLTHIETAHKNKDLAWQRAIKQGLIDYVRQSSDMVTRAPLEFVARSLLTRGASNKMLLEELAFTLPVIQNSDKMII